MRIDEKTIGKNSSGEEISSFSVKEENGLELQCINYGCIITKLFYPDKNGKMLDIVLGHKDLDGYKSGKGFFGAFIGRFANRIKDASFELNGKQFKLDANNGPHHLHGCFSNVIYNAKRLVDGVEFSRISPDGEEGFPGNLSVKVTYRIINNKLRMDFYAESDKDTVLNLTNHSYFNLNGHDAGTILDHYVCIPSSSFLESDESKCPTGVICDVTGTPLDFRNEMQLSEGIDNSYLQRTNGYDHCYVLNADSAFDISVYSEKSGIELRMKTNQPGMQLYSGNGISGIVGKNNCSYKKYGGLAIEAQFFPCSPNYPSFPSTILKPGDSYHTFTEYSFSHRF